MKFKSPDTSLCPNGPFNILADAGWPKPYNKASAAWIDAGSAHVTTWTQCL